MALMIDAKSMARYRETALRRHDQRRRAAEHRRAKGLIAAQRGATFLRDTFGASRVIAFGSLVESDGRWFSDRSDIDLAVAGLSAEEHLIAVARLQELGSDFSFDLVDLDRCPGPLRRMIDESGTEI